MPILHVLLRMTWAHPVQMRVRAHRVLSEPSTKSMVPALAHILALFDKGAVGRTISQIVQFLMSPSLKLCTELTTAAESEEDEEETNGKAQTKQPRAKPAAPRKNAKKAREQRAPQPEEEPSLKRQRGARAGKQKAVAKKPAEKKASKRKAAEVEAEPEPEPEEAGEEEDAPEEEPEGVDVDDEQPDVEMQDEPEEPIQQEGEEEDDEEPVPGLDMHPGPPVIGGPSVPQEMPGEAVQLDQHPAFDGIDSQDQDGEEPEPPPPGLEGDMDHDLATRKHAVYGQVGPPQQEVPPVVPASQRPGIGSQASPCDAAHPGSHGRSQPPQLGPHHLKPPLEGVATSGGQANVSYDNGSVTKARAKGSNKRAPARGAATKSSLGVANAGTGKKSAPHVKRGQQAVAAAAVQKPVAVRRYYTETVVSCLINEKRCMPWKKSICKRHKGELLLCESLSASCYALFS